MKTWRRFCEEYLHELVHIFNFQRHQPDCAANQYHNRRFLEVATGIGLFVKQHKTQGWSRTALLQPAGKHEAPLDKAKKILLEAVEQFDPNMEVIEAARQKIAQKAAQNKPTPCFLKYCCACPPPHNNIRSGRRPDGQHPVHAVCGDCGQPFVCVEKN